MPPTEATSPTDLPPRVESMAGPLLRALQASEVLVALYDPEDRLVYANAAFEAQFIRGLGLPVPFADLLRHGFAGGFGVKIDSGDIEGFLQNILPRRRSRPFRAFESDMIGGGWIWMTETLLPDGWLLSVASDIGALKHTEHTLRAAHQSALEASRTDVLTGTPNRRHILDLGKAALAQAQQLGQPFTIAVIDLDHFKRINDSHGHHGGDEVLRHFSEHCLRQLRPGDGLGRLGGEEFLLLLPGAAWNMGATVVRRLRHTLPAVGRPPGGSSAGSSALRYTFSTGLAQAEAGEDLETLMQRADRALYAAKQRGRNCSMVNIGGVLTVA
jgi:diguanylate cyclase (GGDEF)-like protein